jgi:peptide/nickel transport system permease protein
VLKYVIRRVLLLIPTVIGTSLVIFVLLRLLPADVVDVMSGTDSSMSGQQRAALRAALGLTEPIPVQYAKWLGDVVTGNLGQSLRTQESVGAKMLQSLPITIELSLLALMMAACFGIPLGILSAIRRNSSVDFWARFAGLAGLSIPNFWLATMLLLFSSIVLQWVPNVVWIPPTVDPFGNVLQMLMPAFVLSVQLMAIQMRMARTTMLEVLRHDYIRTARAKGLAERILLVRHALPNAFIPVLTIVGIQLGALIGSSVIIEQVFGLPGVGWFLLQGVYNRDYPVVQATALLLVLVVGLISLGVDVLYAYVDPRIAYE